MKSPYTAAIALLVFIASAFGQAAPRVESVLPQNVAGVLVIRDWPALRQKGIAHPFAAMAGDPRFARFFAPLFKELALEAASEHVPKLTDFLSLGTGQIAATFDPRWFLGPARPIRADSARVIIADIGENGPAVAKMMTLDDDKPVPPATQPAHADAPVAAPGWRTTTSVEQFEGVALHLTATTMDGQRTDTSGWAIVGKQLVIAEPKEELQQTVHAMKVLAHAADAATLGPRLVDLPAFGKFTKIEPGADAFLFVNVPTVIAPLLEKIDKEYLSEFHGSFFKFETYFELSPAGFSRVLGADTIDALYAAMSIGDHTTDFGLGMLHAPPRGLVAALAFSGERPIPPWVPADAVEATAARFDFAQAWRAGIDTITSFRFCDQRVTEALAGARAAGVDVEHDLVASLGQQVAYAELAVTKQPLTRDRLLVIELKDAARFETALAKVIPWINHENAPAGAKVGGVYPIKDFDAFFDGAIAARVAVSHGKLLLTFGRAQAMDEVLKKLSQPGSASFWDKPPVREAIAQMPVDAVGFGFRDGASAVLGAAPLLANIDLIDIGALPEPAVINEYLPRVVTTISSTDGSKSVRIRLDYPAKKAKPATP